LTGENVSGAQQSSPRWYMWQFYIHIVRALDDVCSAGTYTNY